MKLCMIGTGYVGLVSGVCFSDLGNDVICVDKDQDKINNLQKGIIPIYEPGLEELVLKNYKNKKLKFSTDLDSSIKKSDIEYQRNGTYVVMEGPQFSTLAESNLYRLWKADVIGMTNMPEAKLAREAEIRYASVSMVTDFDCWHPDHENVDVQQVIKVLLGNAEKAKVMIKNLIDNFEDHIDPNDPTNNCLDVAIITAPEKRTQKTIDKLKTVAGRVLSK